MGVLNITDTVTNTTAVHPTPGVIASAATETTIVITTTAFRNVTSLITSTLNATVQPEEICTHPGIYILSILTRERKCANIDIENCPLSGEI